MFEDYDSGNSSDSTGAVEVAVQLSRFHVETLEQHNTTGDIDIRGLCLSAGDCELLADAHLSLKRGVRYGLLGRNGSGKSTLLKACAKKTIPSFPRDMKVMYVQQENVPGDDRSALHTVAEAAASERRRLEQQVADLEAALDAEAEAEAAGTVGGGGGEGHEEGAEDEAGEGGGAGTGAAAALVAAVQAVRASRAADTATEADLIAARRSRARGKEALRAAQAARDDAKKTKEQRLSHEEAAALAPQLLAELYEQLEHLQGGTSEEEEQLAAAAVLEGLGFGTLQQATPTQQQKQQAQQQAQQQHHLDAPTRSLSGGWRMRVALACALVAQPQLLLLDEPTNHLDIQSILWLQDYLTTRCEGVTVLLVSHDRAFLNAVAQETVVLRDKRLEYFAGSYDAYVQARAEASVHKERQVAGQERQRQHLLGTIARAEKAAKEAGDDKRLLQAASRRKKLDRIGCDKTADGKKFKVSYWAGYHETQRPQVELDKPEEPVVLQLPPAEALRQRGPLLQLRDVTVAYGGKQEVAAALAAQAAADAAHTASQAAAAPASKGGTAKGGKGSGKAAAAAAAGGKAAGATSAAPAAAAVPGIVLRGVTMDITPGARIGLLGLNGSGKSSLMRVMAGQLAPAAGEVATPSSSRLQVGCLDQHSGRRLLQEGPAAVRAAAAAAGAGAASAAAGAGSEVPVTASAVVQARAPLLRQQEVYDYLGKFAVPGPLASAPLAALSGGQRCRVALALVMLNRPHVLLLDEPTNHLDMQTVQALSAAVKEWEGAVVIASHDLRFLEDTCSEVWVVEGGAVVRQQQPDVRDALSDYAVRLMERVRRRAEKQQRRQAAGGGGGGGGGGGKGGGGHVGPKVVKK